jgi:hypothetical protein
VGIYSMDMIYIEDIHLKVHDNHITHAQNSNINNFQSRIIIVNINDY